VRLGNGEWDEWCATGAARCMPPPNAVYTVDAEQLDIAWKLCYTAGALSTNETSPFFGIGLLLCVFR
jgi:hypothetical protein